MSYKSKDTLSINQWKIKSLPPESRPDEKLESYGAASLSDAELLAIIIRTGFRGYNSVRLAEDILKVTLPIRERILDIQNDDALLARVIKQGADRARERASKTLQEVREIMGIKKFY